MRTRTRPGITVALASLLAIACSNPPAPEQQAQPAPPPPPSAPQPAPQAPSVPAPPTVTLTPDAAGIVHLTANDQMRFNATRIEVVQGATVQIELKNIGTQPKAAMGHNFTLFQPGTDLAAFALLAQQAAATDYIPSPAPQLLAHTKLLGPGETDTITLPTLQPGTYPFSCLFPGHYVLMQGQLVVAAQTAAAQ